MSTTAPTAEQASLSQAVYFESDAATRTYVLNRPKKLNALNEEMLNTLRPQIEEWTKSDLCKVIVGTGLGRAFCAGGDVANVLQDSLHNDTRSKAIDFFKREFEMDYILSAMPKPYVAVMDGITMGGGVGLSISAPFRVATEKTVFAMPETKIGYCPDVGASFFLSRMDGEVGTYLALTAETLTGREVFEHGFATHFISSRAVPNLLSRLSDLENAAFGIIDRTIEELHAERQADESPTRLTGPTRKALDTAFRHDSVELILQDLQGFTTPDSDPAVRKWAEQTLETLHLRSPTSLKVALSAVRRGRNMNLLEVLQMELGIATAFCSGASPDFQTGISAVLIDKIQGRPAWCPSTVAEVSPELVDRFFSADSVYHSATPRLSPPDMLYKDKRDPMRYALPTEAEIGHVVQMLTQSNNNSAIALSVLLSKFDDLRPGKHGIKEKVLEVVQRRCDLTNREGITSVLWQRRET
ncbi:hypothetical protein SERLADRAFT_398624 [Serpula lacrymans var. lacrymans S7.9]|nr:uncharacterized protein SERLADRAFT_398624 [Serpula lacrymans var. lacrymans S7.9]EGO21178.1 hypothetical protein SERLADRAFT_398624 [Serpula lacrymans var. lacrymans S7.9]